MMMVCGAVSGTQSGRDCGSEAGCPCAVLYLTDVISLVFTFEVKPCAVCSHDTTIVQPACDVRNVCLPVGV